MVSVPEIHLAQSVSTTKRENASPVPHTAHLVCQNQSVRLVSQDSNLMRCNMKVSSTPTVWKFAVMVKDLNSTAMTVTPRIMTAVMKTVKLKVAGIVKEDLVLKLAHVSHINLLDLLSP